MVDQPSGLLARLAADGPEPAYQRLAERLRAEILDGRIVIGRRLPSERSIAQALALSRTTVTAAYGLLRAEGFLLSRPGSNSVAALPAAPVDRPDSDRVKRDPAGNGYPEIDMTVAAMPAPAMLGALAVQAAAGLPALASGPGLHPFGIPALRAAIAARLSSTGLPSTPDQILITQGALHSWDLVLRAFLRPGEVALIEQPSYPGVYDAARAHSAQVAPLAVSSRGWDLDGLPAAAVLAHVTPDLQNPTGLIAEDHQRQALLNALPRTVLVTDETFAELSLTTRRRPLAAFARSSRVITVCSLSKSVWAGLRVGWLRASPELVRRIAMARSGQDLASPVLDQLLAVAVFEQLPSLLEQRRSLLRTRRNHLTQALATLAPQWRFTVPDGGLVLWVELDCSSAELARRALAYGVRIAPGTRFSATATHDRFMRLPFCHPEPVLDDALERLLQAARDRRSSRVRPRADAVWTA